MAMTRHNNPTTHRGFTLLEMLAALVIGGIIVTPLYVITRGMTRQTNLQRVEIEASQRARTGMSVLLSDLARTGLHASQDPLNDADSLCHQQPSSTECPPRLALVHGNRMSSGNDAILIVGDFLGPKLYPAILTENNAFVIQAEGQDDDGGVTNPLTNCTRVFNPAYSYGHALTKDGKTWDFPISNVEEQPCTVYTSADPDLVGLPTGSEVFLGASQAAFYTVETAFPDTAKERDELVRYFVDYSGQEAVGNCQNPLGNLVTNTRQVVAAYVANFQVWFRATHIDTGTNHTVPLRLPNNYSRQTLVDNAADFTLTLDDGSNYGIEHVIRDLDSPTIDTNDLSCDSSSGNVQAGAINSAVIQLSVRATQANQSVDATAFGASRVAFHTIEAVPDGDQVDQQGTIYLRKTMTTEVTMPNL